MVLEGGGGDLRWGILDLRSGGDNEIEENGEFVCTGRKKGTHKWR